MKIGVITDCFKKTHKDGIETASALRLDGVQIYATTGEFSPALSQKEKDEYKKLLKEKGLVVSALCGDMGGYGFEKEVIFSKKKENVEIIGADNDVYVWSSESANADDTRHGTLSDVSHRRQYCTAFSRSFFFPHHSNCSSFNSD